MIWGLLLVVPSFGQPSQAGIQQFFAQSFEEQLRDNPEFATGVGRHEYDDRWGDWSKAGREQRRAHLRQRSRKRISPRKTASARG